jgi:hypothetical protein
MKFGEDMPAVLEGKRKKTVIIEAVIAPLIKDRLAELVFRNGGSFRVTGWGMKQAGIGIYGEIGLDAAQAFDLMHLSGILVGFALASSVNRQQVFDDVMTTLKDIWRTKGWEEE